MFLESLEKEVGVQRISHTLSLHTAINASPASVRLLSPEPLIEVSTLHSLIFVGNPCKCSTVSDISICLNHSSSSVTDNAPFHLWEESWCKQHIQRPLEKELSYTPRTVFFPSGTFHTRNTLQSYTLPTQATSQLPINTSNAPRSFRVSA